jgi:orotidine-5'-phosphate decarboxylase
MNPKIIVALDFNDISEIRKFISGISPDECRLKIGKELFTCYGPEVVREVQNAGFEVFLDLKFHDIPNTVYKAIKAAANLGVWMVNVHASGGREMLLAAKKAIEEGDNKPLLIAVTILTSLGAEEIEEIGFSRDLTEQTLHLAKLAYDSGIDGVVCSAWEAQAIKDKTSRAFLTVTPGIRLSDSKTDDQTRIMTPQMAIKNGADYLVIGRPITQSQNPLQALHDINLNL